MDTDTSALGCLNSLGQSYFTWLVLSRTVDERRGLPALEILWSYSMECECFTRAVYRVRRLEEERRRCRENSFRTNQ